MLHGLCFGEELKVSAAGEEFHDTVVFFCLKCLQLAKKGTSSVRRVRLGVVSCANCSSYASSNEWLFLCA